MSINIKGVSKEDGKAENMDEEEEEDEEVVGEVEEVIDSLLQGLKDKDTIVR